MSTSPAIQIPSTTIDAVGVSIVAGPKSLSTTQAGQIFNPTDFAAGVPVYFHPLGNSQFIGLYSERWYDATVLSADPNTFSAHSVDSVPTWIGFNATTGFTSRINGQIGFTPPTRTTGTLTLTAGASRSVSYLYILNSVVNGDVTTALVQNFHVGTVGSVKLIAEETLPTIVIDDDPIVFSKGVLFDTPYLYYAGTNSSNQIFLARKNWGAVGGTGGASTKSTPPLGVGVGAAWNYRTTSGWSADFTQAAPLKTASGTDLTTEGPVSFGMYRDRTYMSVVKNSSGTVTGQVYVSKGVVDPWKPVGDPISLGSVGSTYLGGGVQLQPTLNPNPANAIVTSGANVTAIPWVTAVKDTTGGNAGITTTWGLSPVSRIA